MAVVLSVCAVLLVFYERDEIHSNAVENVSEDSEHTEVYFADADAAVATDTDALADIAEVGDADSIKSGDIVYHGNEAYTRYYTVCKNGIAYRAYCGDHKKNAVRSTNNVSFAEDNGHMIRLAFAYGPDSVNAWRGFAGMGENDRQLIMSLTLNYLRHGQYFSVISSYLEFLKSADDSIISLKSDETGLGFVVEGGGDRLSHDVVLDEYRKYTIPGTSSERKRTRVIKLEGNAGNSIELQVPHNSWMHVKKNGDKEYKIYRSGKTSIGCGDRLFFTADRAYTGSCGKLYAEGKSGLTVYTADSNDTDLDQQLLFADMADCGIVTVSLEWEDANDSGYMWLTKNKKYNFLNGKVENTTSYHAGRYGTENYSYAGIAYDVTDQKGSVVYRFVLSYDGMCYVGKSTGRQLVIKNRAEKERCAGKIAVDYAKLPFGTYSVIENKYLWKVDSVSGKLISTDAPVSESGYQHDPTVQRVTITDNNTEKSMAKAYHLAAHDDEITGKFRLKKRDADTSEPVKGAVYYVVRKSSGGVTADRVVAKLKTDLDGIGIVYESDYGSIGAELLENLPIGVYEIYEKMAPAGYEKNGDVAVLSIMTSGSILSVDGNIVSSTDGYEICWDTTDRSVCGSLEFSIYKQDAETGLDVQGNASLKGAEFTVCYYKGSYDTVEQLPEKADKKWVLETDISGVCMLQEKYLAQGRDGDSLDTDEDGNALLQTGTVTVQETAPPEGYTLDDSVVRNGDTGEILSDVKDGVCITKLINDDQKLHMEFGNELIVGNHVIRGDFQFCKKDESTGKALSGVKFLIENQDKSESVVIYTDENGFYSSSSSHIKHSTNTNSGESESGIWFGSETVDDDKGALPYGKYYLSELRCDANSGKYKSAETVGFTVDSDGVVVDLGDILNERFPEITTAARYKDTGGKMVSESENETDIIDTVMMRGLEKGHKYTLHGEVLERESEKILPQEGAVNEVNFTADDINMDVDVPFRIDVSELGGKDLVCYQVLTDAAYEGEIIAEHRDINAEGQTVHVGGKNLEISKKSVTGTEELCGAELVLTDSSGEEIDRWISDSIPHVIKNIKPGEYILNELSAPAGYLLSEEIRFTVDDTAGIQKIQMIDEIARIRLKKVDDVRGIPLAGVRFDLYCSESGEKVGSKTTDDNGYLEFEYVVPGDYYLVEKNIPDRYMPVDLDKNGRINITVERDQYENPPVKTVENHYGSVYVYKTDKNKDTALGDAVFGLFDMKTDRLIMKATSSADGYAEFRQVPPGQYYIKEENAPPGYEKCDSVIKIDTEKTIYDKKNPVTVVNERTNTTTKKKSPSTGDGALLVITMVFFIVTILLAVILVIHRKKYSEND